MLQNAVAAPSPSSTTIQTILDVLEGEHDGELTRKVLENKDEGGSTALISAGALLLTCLRDETRRDELTTTTSKSIGGQCRSRQSLARCGRRSNGNHFQRLDRIVSRLHRDDLGLSSFRDPDTTQHQKATST